MNFIYIQILRTQACQGFLCLVANWNKTNFNLYVIKIMWPKNKKFVNLHLVTLQRSKICSLFISYGFGDNGSNLFVVRWHWVTCDIKMFNSQSETSKSKFSKVCNFAFSNPSMIANMLHFSRSYMVSEITANFSKSCVLKNCTVYEIII